MTEKEKDKVRVYELAKELKLDSRRLIDLLHRLKVENIKNHMSTVEPEAVKTVRDIMEGKLPPEPKAEQKPAQSPRPAPVQAERPRPSAPPRTASSGPAPTGAPRHTSPDGRRPADRKSPGRSSASKRPR